MGRRFYRDPSSRVSRNANPETLQLEANLFRGQTRLHVEGLDEERPFIGSFFNHLARRFAGAVTGFDINAN